MKKQHITTTIISYILVGFLIFFGDCSIKKTTNPEDKPSGEESPFDLVDIAPELDLSVSTDLATATAFLYTGDNPIQEGMDPNTIEAHRVAVLRGKVLTGDGEPLPGVKVCILDHTEYGHTYTRENGMFDMVVNGGGYYTVCYEKEGYLGAQRQVRVPWQDYVWLPDVALMQMDENVTAIDFSEPMQVARGSEITDSDGTRQGTLMVPWSTTAEMVMSDGSTQVLTDLNVSITEYTVGEIGPEAMPAELPPTSGYTYCVDFNDATAEASGAVDVRFDEPLYYYVEDFIGFPVGSAVPTGYYDERKGQWVASENGRVIEVVNTAGGLAELDTDGDGASDDPATLQALDITYIEREKIAALYTPGQVLWRVPILHFTPWDCNWPYGPPDDAIPPPAPEPPKPDDDRDDCDTDGSIITIQSQVLGESIPITGTPYSLNYRSHRVLGRIAERTLNIPLSEDTLPASLEEIILEIEIAGRKFKQTYPPQTNLTHTFTWDGKDTYGRTLQGGQPVTVRTKYRYKPEYYGSWPDFMNSFGRINPSADVVASRSASSIFISKTMEGILGPYDARGQGLGAWTIDVHHAYDPGARVLYLGNGERRSSDFFTYGTIRTVAGNGFAGYSGDGGPATEAELGTPRSVAVGPDGSLYITQNTYHCIRRVDRAGIITTAAGNGVSGFGGDGGPASEASLDFPRGIAVGPDGSLYIADFGNHRIRRVGPDGIITTVAGIGVEVNSGDWGPATEAGVKSPVGVAVGPDGSLYIAQANTHRVRHVGPDGIITKIAGDPSGYPGYSGDGGPAAEATLNYPSDIAVGTDGSLYIADRSNNCIRRVGTDGIITTVAGTGSAGYSEDGTPAILTEISNPEGITTGSDGSLYIIDSHLIRRVGPDGIITTVAGNRNNYDSSGDGGPATDAGFFSPFDVALGPYGLYIADLHDDRVRLVAAHFPGRSTSEIRLPSVDGMVVYIFDETGRHLRTLHTLTGGLLFQFRYNENGQLVEIEDGDGNITIIERNSSGDPLAVIGPYGQSTSLDLDKNGYLAKIFNPAGENTKFSYTDQGLLTRITDAENNTSTYAYDNSGRLARTEDPAGGFQTFARTEFDNGYEVVHTTALGKSSTYRVERLPTGGQRRVNTFCCGKQIEEIISTNGTRQITFPDETVTTLQYGPDPRFKMQTSITKYMNIITPGGLNYTVNITRNVTLQDQDDPLSLENLNDTVNINDRIYTRNYDAATGKMSITTPENRITTVTLDTQGRVVEEQLFNLEPFIYNYDSHGRLVLLSQGTGNELRGLNLGYDSAGYVSSVEDPLAQIEYAEYDPAGRQIKQTLKDGREVFYSYDKNANMISMQPPGRPQHKIAFTPLYQQSGYSPPDVGSGTNSISYIYNKDRQLSRIIRPDSTQVEFIYDSMGRLHTINLARGTLQCQYDAISGYLSSLTTPEDGLLSFTYDGPLLTGWTWGGAQGSITGGVEVTYDEDFRLNTRQVNNGPTIFFIYDNDKLLTQAGDMVINRDAETGFISNFVLGNTNQVMSYNVFGEIEMYEATYNTTNLLSNQFTRDKLSRIVKNTETIGGVTDIYDYTYDGAGRLSEVSKNGYTIAHYTYDANGNRLSYDGIEGFVTGSYDDQDRLLEYGTVNYIYTANGELQSKTDTSTGHTTEYVYDEFGNLLQVTLHDGTEIEYVIDGLNRRIGKKINGTLVQGFLYKDQLNPIAELDEEGNIVARFIYAGRYNVPDYMIKDSKTYCIISDQLGSPRLVVDTATGTIAQRIDYDVFGNVLSDTNPGFQPFGFAGGLYDRESKLIRFGARDYDPSLGRWTLKDPIFAPVFGTNLYVYSDNDPVNFFDIWGFRPTTTRYDFSDEGSMIIAVKNPNDVEGVENWVQGGGAYSGLLCSGRTQISSCLEFVESAAQPETENCPPSRSKAKRDPWEMAKRNWGQGEWRKAFRNACNASASWIWAQLSGGEGAEGEGPAIGGVRG